MTEQYLLDGLTNDEKIILSYKMIFDIAIETFSARLNESHASIEQTMFHMVRKELRGLELAEMQEMISEIRDQMEEDPDLSERSRKDEEK